MNILISLTGLLFLIWIAYRGYSVILFAPIAALLPTLLTHPGNTAEVFTSLYMEKLVYFMKLYFPILLLGAIFGKVYELTGCAQSIVTACIRFFGDRQVIVTVTLLCALLTYGGVSLFVVVFAVYPFAAEMFRRAQVPKRLLPATLALGAFSFTMDALPGTPQIQNIIPTTFFGTTPWAAPLLGILGSIFIFAAGAGYLTWRMRRAEGEGYGEGHTQEPEVPSTINLIHPGLALLPLVAVPTVNLLLGIYLKRHTAPVSSLALPGLAAPLVTNASGFLSLWALEGALLLGIALTVMMRPGVIKDRFINGSKAAVAGALLATANTASEYGFGAAIAASSGFVAVRSMLGGIPYPLLNAAVTTTSLAGITGSASGGLGIALAAMSVQFRAMAETAHIPLEVLHRVTAMASGGMDDLPHNGAVITVLAITGLTHKQAYKDIFVITLLKFAGVLLVILVYSLTGLV